MLASECSDSNLGKSERKKSVTNNNLYCIKIHITIFIIILIRPFIHIIKNKRII